ncbi:MAG: hypothetical protein O7C59_07945, partial [Rickettsia endosymbiont of Ixodes persulcatus]|nr:hypothetical protein [Rickettsia endosymbiont of Ixodes persulcatus]
VVNYSCRLFFMIVSRMLLIVVWVGCDVSMVFIFVSGVIMNVSLCESVIGLFRGETLLGCFSFWKMVDGSWCVLFNLFGVAGVECFVVVGVCGVCMF